MYDVDGENRRIVNVKLLTYNIKVRRCVSNVVRCWNTPDTSIAGMVISNLIACYRKNTHLVYSRNKSDRIFIGRREVSVRNLLKVVDWLADNGYIANHIGKASKNSRYREVSYMDASYKLLRQFGLTDEDIYNIENDMLDEYKVIELRDADKSSIEYRETKALKQMKENVQRINKLNAKHDVRDGNGQPLNNIYCRVFNETFENGGRFYRADILQLKNTNGERLDVTIDSESVIEVDFSNLHFRIAAAVEGMNTLDLPIDVYSGMLEDEKNMVDRQLVKLAVNIMFNSKSWDSAAKAIQSEINSMSDELKSKVTVGSGKSIVALVKDSYPDFSDMFCIENSFGRRLQYMDSELACDIMLKFSELDKPILPIHDSFIVKRHDLDLLTQTMGDCFRARFKVEDMVPVGIKWKDNNIVYEDKVLV